MRCVDNLCFIARYKLFIEITVTRTLKKVDDVPLFSYLLPTNVISSSLAGRMKKLNGLLLVPGLYSTTKKSHGLSCPQLSLNSLVGLNLKIPNFVDVSSLYTPDRKKGEAITRTCQSRAKSLINLEKIYSASITAGFMHGETKCGVPV